MQWQTLVWNITVQNLAYSSAKRVLTFDTLPLTFGSYDLYTAIRGPFGTTDNIHTFPEVDVIARFPENWQSSSSGGLCTGNNSALVSFRTPRHDYWQGPGNLELLSADASLLDGDVVIEEVSFAIFARTPLKYALCDKMR